MLRYSILIIVALLLYCSSVQAACDDKDSKQLWKRITAPAMQTFRMPTDSRAAAEKQLRGTVRTELNMLHSFVSLGDSSTTNQTIRAYYAMQGRDEVGEWIVANGGAALLARTIPCFKRNYRKMLFNTCCGKCHY